MGAPVGKTHLPEVRVSEHPQALSFGLKLPQVPDQHRVDRRTEGRIGHRTEAEGRFVVEWWHDGVAEAMWRAQPLINNARKMPSAEGVLRALARALVLEGGEIYKNVSKASKE